MTELMSCFQTQEPIRKLHAGNPWRRNLPGWHRWHNLSVNAMSSFKLLRWGIFFNACSCTRSSACLACQQFNTMLTITNKVTRGANEVKVKYYSKRRAPSTLLKKHKQLHWESGDIRYSFLRHRTSISNRASASLFSRAFSMFANLSS